MRLSAVTYTHIPTALTLALILGVGATACSSSKHASPPSPVGTSSTSAPVGSTTVPRPTVPPTTPTTASVPPHAHVPLSATFVSSRTGWVLEGNAPFCGAPDRCAYAIAQTTDGGASWTARATFPFHLGDTPRIRFADSLTGFVFDDESIAQTHDGGAHWGRLSLPFQGVQALEIAGGVVYVVGGTPTGASPGFGYHIFSSPADRIEWTMDPLPVPVGAGPVPRQQLVLTHGAGWMVNLDRTVVGGARLAPGRWTTWTPPCASLAGPVTLTASSSTDLAASCDEHVYDGQPTNAVYFSDDGGATFTRRPAPTSGDIASPDATTAVIASGAGAWRTTNRGDSWRQVVKISEADGRTVLELGFTTSTQGFLIEGAGGMLMTRDAGATWDRVAMP